MVDGVYTLEKFPGKGGWTYAAIPEIAQNKSNPFGWVSVSGFIDDVELKKYKLMPMGNGLLFLPVKASIRKKIKKEAGDNVRVKLVVDESPAELPDEIKACFELESPKLIHVFQSLPASTQKSHLDFIYSAKNEMVKAERIAEVIKQIQDVRFKN